MIRWSGRNQAQPSEEVVGRITRKGAWDRRWRPTELGPHDSQIGWREVAAFIGQVVFILVLFGSLIVVAGIIAVTQPPVPGEVFP